MAKDWIYAKLSKEAKENGGPEQLLEKKRQEGYQKGYKDRGKEQVLDNFVGGITHIVSEFVFNEVSDRLKKRKDRKNIIEEVEEQKTDQEVKDLKDIDLDEIKNI